MNNVPWTVCVSRTKEVLSYEWRVLFFFLKCHGSQSLRLRGLQTKGGTNEKSGIRASFRISHPNIKAVRIRNPWSIQELIRDPPFLQNPRIRRVFIEIRKSVFVYLFNTPSPPTNGATNTMQHFEPPYMPISAERPNRAFRFQNFKKYLLGRFVIILKLLWR